MPDRSHLEELFEAIDEGYCLCEMIRDSAGHALDYRFLDTNPLFEKLTGLRDAQGRTALEMVPGLERSWIDTYDKVARGETMRFQSGSDVMGRMFDVFATPVEPAGRFALVFRDITEQRRAEREREDAREAAERLLVELNHRVMNTLAMITSFTRIEASQITGDTEGRHALARLQARLAAVTTLYRALNRAATVRSVSARSYLHEVVGSVAASVAEADRIAVTSEIADVELPTAQAAPLGLMVNELMTNALKYAFPDNKRGHIHIKLALCDDGLCLTVADDGVGMSDTPAPHGTGLGGEIVAAFTQQLGGTMNVETGATGTAITVSFPQPEIRAPRAG